jgi:hypothetical protein
MQKREYTSSQQDTELPSRKGRRKIGKARLGIALGAVAVGASVLVPGTPAYASDSNCTVATVFRTCIYITGGGAHVNSIEGEVYNIYIDPSANIHTELVYPSGAFIKNSSTVTIPSDKWGAAVTWAPNANEPTGNYCAISWQGTSASGYTVIGKACAPVSA